MPELADLLRVPRREGLPDVQPGDTVRVTIRVVEGNRERPQVFEGVVMEVRRPKTFEGCFRVRRIASGVGVERLFMFQSPRVEKIEVTRRGAVRRAKLYYLRGLTGKAARIKEKRTARGVPPARTPATNGVATSTVVGAAASPDEAVAAPEVAGTPETATTA